MTKGPLWDETTDTAELYDPATGTFSSTGLMNDSRYSHTATLLPNGKVLIAAGYTQYPHVELNTAEIYDPYMGTFTATDSLDAARYSHTATLLSNGMVLLAGGRDTASVELYDPATGLFSSTTAMNTFRQFHTSTLLPDGRVLVTGGSSYTWGPLNSAEIYSLPDTGGAFSPTGHLSLGRVAFTATRLSDGKVLVFGGYNSLYGILPLAEVYAPGQGGFSTTVLGWYFSGHTATLPPSGKVLVAGGYDGDDYLTMAQLYDPATGTLGSGGNMGAARSFHTATVLANGKVLIVGGYDGTYLASADLYDPATGNFSPTGGMTTARAGHTATLLANGKVLIAGGNVSGGWYSATAELYDPATGTFSTTGPMGTKRAAHTATLLRNDKVLIAGGYGQVGSGPLHTLDTAELYDLATGTFTPTGSMSSAREYHTATLLLNGKVLIAGGTVDIYSQPTLASAELYDPETEAFSDVGSMGMARARHAATLLADGRVLLTGGEGWVSYLFFSELFQVADPIPVGWQTSGVTRHDYKAIECSSWWDCENKAVAEGAHLVSINDAAEQNWLIQTFGGKYLYWIGLNDETTEGTFGWISGEPVTYTNWAPGEPNDWGGDEDYAIMNWSTPGLWNDAYLYSMAVTMGIIERSQPPDLIENGMSSPPAYAASGSSFTIWDEAMNQGSGASSVQSSTRFYLSLDAVKGSGDILLDGVRTVPPMPSGTTSGTAATMLTIPSGTPSGAYYLIACVDDLGEILEGNEGNNCLASVTTISVCVAPGYISVTPWEDFSSSGPQGGPFSPSSTTYTLTNPGGCPLDWTASRFSLPRLQCVHVWPEQSRPQRCEPEPARSGTIASSKDLDPVSSIEDR
jgi:hypothetical protein